MATNSFTISRKWSLKSSIMRKKTKTLNLLKVTTIAFVMCVLVEKVFEDCRNS